MTHAMLGSYSASLGSLGGLGQASAGEQAALRDRLNDMVRSFNASIRPLQPQVDRLPAVERAEVTRLVNSVASRSVFLATRSIPLQEASVSRRQLSEFSRELARIQERIGTLIARLARAPAPVPPTPTPGEPTVEPKPGAQLLTKLVPDAETRGAIMRVPWWVWLLVAGTGALALTAVGAAAWRKRRTRGAT